MGMKLVSTDYMSGRSTINVFKQSEKILQGKISIRSDIWIITESDQWNRKRTSKNKDKQVN